MYNVNDTTSTGYTPSMQFRNNAQFSFQQTQPMSGYNTFVPSNQTQYGLAPPPAPKLIAPDFIRQSMENSNVSGAFNN